MQAARLQQSQRPIASTAGMQPARQRAAGLTDALTC